MARAFENVRGQLFRRRLSCASRDRNNRFAPRGVNAMRKQLQSSDRVLDEQQAIAESFEFRIAADAIGTRDCGDSAFRKGVGDERVSIDKLAIKSGADVVRLRKRKEQLARANRTRIDGIIGNLFVKQLGACGFS